MDSPMIFGAGLAVVALGILAAIVMRGKWDLLAAHLSDHTRHLVAFVLLIGTSVGSLWFYSGGRLAFGGLQEIALNAGGVTIATEVAALVAASYVARIDRLLMASKGVEAKHWRGYRRKVLMWFYVGASVSGIANIAFRLNEYGSATWEQWLQAVFSGAVPIVLVNLLLIVLRPVPVAHTQRGRDKAQRMLGDIIEEAGKVVQSGMRALARGEELTQDRLAALMVAWTFYQPYAGEDAGQIGHALKVYAPAQSGLALPDGGRYFDKHEIMQLWAVPERTAQSWLTKSAGTRTRAGTRRLEAPATALYELHGVPAVTAMELEAKPTRNRATTRSEPQEGAIEAQGRAEEAQAIIYDAQPVAG